MQSIWKSKGKKLHARNIEISTYNYDEERIIVEGCLKEDRFQDSYMVTGEVMPSGTIHNMVIRILVNCSNFLIEDIDVDMISFPREVCRETIDCLAPIKGMTITRGFTARIKKIAGGKKGCTHLVELILAMAPAAFQGYAAFQSQRKKDFDPDRAKMVLQYLGNTCHAWRDDGPLAENYKKMFNME